MAHLQKPPTSRARAPYVGQSRRRKAKPSSVSTLGREFTVALIARPDRVCSQGRGGCQHVGRTSGRSYSRRRIEGGHRLPQQIRLIGNLRLFRRFAAYTVRKGSISA